MLRREDMKALLGSEQAANPEVVAPVSSEHTVSVDAAPLAPLMTDSANLPIEPGPSTCVSSTSSKPEPSAGASRGGRRPRRDSRVTAQTPPDIHLALAQSIATYDMTAAMTASSSQDTSSVVEPTSKLVTTHQNPLMVRELKRLSHRDLIEQALEYLIKKSLPLDGEYTAIPEVYESLFFSIHAYCILRDIDKDDIRKILYFILKIITYHKDRQDTFLLNVSKVIIHKLGGLTPDLSFFYGKNKICHNHSTITVGARYMIQGFLESDHYKLIRAMILDSIEGLFEKIGYDGSYIGKLTLFIGTIWMKIEPDKAQKALDFFANLAQTQTSKVPERSTMELHTAAFQRVTPLTVDALTLSTAGDWSWVQKSPKSLSESPQSLKSSPRPMDMSPVSSPRLSTDKPPSPLSSPRLPEDLVRSLQKRSQSPVRGAEFWCSSPRDEPMSISPRSGSPVKATHGAESQERTTSPLGRAVRPASPSGVSQLFPSVKAPDPETVEKTSQPSDVKHTNGCTRSG